MNLDTGPKFCNRMSVHHAVQVSTSIKLETPNTEFVVGINKAMRVLSLAEYLPWAKVKKEYSQLSQGQEKQSLL